MASPRFGGMEAVLDRHKVILSRIAELEVERARIEAETSALMLEFQDLRRVQAEANDAPTVAPAGNDRIHRA